MQDKIFDILALNETRLDPAIADGEIDIEGYNIVRRDRNRYGGGIAFYIRNTLNFITRRDLNHEDLEILTIEIKKPKSKPFLVTTWYRPPDSKIEILEKFETCLLNLDKEEKESIVLGDFNCNLLSKSSDQNTDYLNFLVEAYQYVQLINEATRITPNSRTLIDHIITNKPDKITRHGVAHIGISDHSLIYAIRKHHTTKSEPKVIESRQFKNFDSSAFTEDIKDTPFHFATLLDNPNEMWDVWKILFLEVVNKHAPIRKRKVRNTYSPWLTSEIKRKIRQRDYLKKQAVKLNLEQNWREYKEARNEVTTCIREAKASYFNEGIKANSGNIKETWKIINKSLGRKSKTTVINKLSFAGKDFTENEDIANQMNVHFCSLGEKLAANIPETDSQPEDFIEESATSFSELRPVTEEYVHEAITNLNTSKSCGLDKISSKLLKLSSPYISDSICAIINQIFETGIFPDDWKKAKVCPIYKADERNIPDNYRPISILPAISKVAERIVHTQLLAYMQENKLLTESQSGFRPMHSTCTALLAATNIWLKNMDNGALNGSVFIDLKKAFDTVDHKILLRKLKCYGVTGGALHFFESYLSNRSQRCYVNGILSREELIPCGIPQGSILGPLLFIIYVNDFPKCLNHSTPGMFADDTYITTANENIIQIENMLNDDLAAVGNWLKTNKLSCNTKKQAT